jgi:hypothetical protein
MSSFLYCNIVYKNPKDPIHRRGIDTLWVACQEGFQYHHAEPGYVMLTYWIPDYPCMLPTSPSHQIGVGGFVINDKKEVCSQESDSPVFLIISTSNSITASH